jgi:hypothetical protein
MAYDTAYDSPVKAPEPTMVDAAKALTESAARAAAASSDFLTSRSAWEDARSQLDAAWREYIEARERQNG